MTDKEIDALIEKLGLVPLEGEGGLMRQTYMSPVMIEEGTEKEQSCGTIPASGTHSGTVPGTDTNTVSGTNAGTNTDTAIGTAIYYMLRGRAFSHMHRLTGDEMYHFYLGDPVELLELFPDGTWRVTILGPDILDGQKVQHLVKAGTWQGSRLVPGGCGALLATTNWPGYTDASYTHGNASELIQQYPEAAEYIRALTGEVRFS